MQSPLDFARADFVEVREQGAWPPAPPEAATPAHVWRGHCSNRRLFEMAVYRCEVKTLRRADGRSAVAAAAYRSAERLRDQQSGRTFDYRRRAPGVAYREVMAGRDAPEWARQRSALWNAAERAENRRNSITAREVLLSLPNELDDVQRIELVRSFADGLIDRYGVAVDIAIHRPDRKGDQRNHHAHLLMTTRRLTPEGLAEKTRELDDLKKRGPQEIEAIRELWEREQNLALERAGCAERVNCLSNRAQGLDREPQPKLGKAATALMRRDESSHSEERSTPAEAQAGDKPEHQTPSQGFQRAAAKQEQTRPTAQFSAMRYHMARQRSGKLGQEKADAIARALQAAAAQGFNATASPNNPQAQGAKQAADVTRDRLLKTQDATNGRVFTPEQEAIRQSALRKMQEQELERQLRRQRARGPDLGR